MVVPEIPLADLHILFTARMTMIHRKEEDRTKIDSGVLLQDGGRVNSTPLPRDEEEESEEDVGATPSTSLPSSCFAITEEAVEAAGGRDGSSVTTLTVSWRRGEEGERGMSRFEVSDSPPPPGGTVCKRGIHIIIMITK